MGQAIPLVSYHYAFQTFLGHSGELLLTYFVSCIHVFRYRAENLLVSFMTPGPTEPTGAQLQNYM
jgi:hypothetical protein